MTKGIGTGQSHDVENLVYRFKGWSDLLVWTDASFDLKEDPRRGERMLSTWFDLPLTLDS